MATVPPPGPMLLLVEPEAVKKALALKVAFV